MVSKPDNTMLRGRGPSWQAGRADRECRGMLGVDRPSFAPAAPLEFWTGRLLSSYTIWTRAPQ